MDPTGIDKVVNRFFDAGNPVAPFRRLAEIADSPSRIEKGEWLSKLADALKRYDIPISEAERTEILRILSAIAGESRLAASIRSIEGIVKSHPGWSAFMAAGTVNVLFLAATIREEAFGVCQPLLFSLNRGSGDELRFSPKFPRGNESELKIGFDRGMAAARRWFGDTATGAAAVPSLRAEFPYLSVKGSGESHGLAVAVGAASRFLGLQVPPDVGFTGRVDAAGIVYRVEGVKEKMEGARDKGLRRVLVPPGTDVGHAGAGDRDIAVMPVSCLAEAMECVYGKRVVGEAVARVPRQEGKLPSGRSADPGRPGGFDGKPAGILFTWVAGADPYGRERNSSNEPLAGIEEGPILGLVRQIRPESIHLLYTVGPEPRNDFRVRAGQVRETIEDLFGIPTAMHPAEAIKDPTEFAEVIDAALSVVREVKAGEGSEVCLELNVTSGTPHMQLSWFYVAGKTDVDCRFWKVLEPRFAKGKPRAVLTRLP